MHHSYPSQKTRLVNAYRTFVNFAVSCTKWMEDVDLRKIVEVVDRLDRQDRIVRSQSFRDTALVTS